MNRIDEIKRMMTEPNPPTLQQYANAVLDLLSEVKRLQAESYRDAPDEFGFPRTKYLGELPFVWQYTAGELQVYRPEDFAAENNPGPIGFIPASALAAIIADLAEPSRSDAPNVSSEVT